MSNELLQEILDGGYCKPATMEKLRALLAKPAAQHQGEPVVTQYRVVRHDPREQKYSVWFEVEEGKAGADKLEQIAISLRFTQSRGEPALYEIRRLCIYAEQPAPAAVVLPVDWQDQLFAEMDRRFELRKLDEDHMANDDTQIGVEFAMKWVADRLDEVARLNPPQQ